MTDKKTVYLVRGLMTALCEIIPAPQIVKTVLLPWRGEIVYDGLVSPYPLMFGRNMTAAFKEIYLSAKQQRTVITTLVAKVRQITACK